MSGIFFSHEERADLRERVAADGDWGGTEWGEIIERFIDASEAPCGSCHPCSEWAAETWRRAGGKLPHKHTVDEWHQRMLVAEVGIDLLRKVRDYWDGRPHGGHGDHIYADVCDVLRAIEPARPDATDPAAYQWPDIDIAGEEIEARGQEYWA
jgi:hypothetical protein